MSDHIKALMENRTIHWQDEALCLGDDRFTGRKEWLAYHADADMEVMCANCPVFAECDEWASETDPDGNPAVSGVFAAGYWRGD